MLYNLDLETMLIALCDDLSLDVDLRNYLVSRLQAEGLKFLTVTLPKLDTILLFGLETGSLAGLKSNIELGCTCFRWKCNAPYMFAGLLNRIFCPNTGRILDTPDEVAIYALRQLSLYFYKLAVDFDESVLEEATEKFVREDESLDDSCIDFVFVDKMRKNLETAYAFPSISTVLATCRPRSGPGTFAGTRAQELPWYVYKSSPLVVNTTLSSNKGISGYFKTRPGHNGVNYVDRDTGEHSELLFVPKDSRGPRSIVREPLHALQAQMSFFDYFSAFFERHSHGRINFSDQRVNNNLARTGSINGSFSTLDLKSASDRVSFSLVKRLSMFTPALRFFLKFRTRSCKLPDGRIVELKKLAGMGSGLTFLWLALTAHTAISTEISRVANIPFREASNLVYVYGDDVVVPTTYMSCAKRALAKCALLVNEKKSFGNLHYGRTGYFRESCGGDYFNGCDVTPIKLRLPSADISVVGKSLALAGDTSLNALNAHAKELKRDGMNRLGDIFYCAIEEKHGRLVHSSNYRSSAIARFTRRYIEYPQDSTGMYIKYRLMVPCPVLLDIPLIYQDNGKRYASSLKPSVDTLGIWDYYDNLMVGLPDGVIAIPRQVRIVRKRVSGIDLIG